jgi:uncharacterized membrane protein YphA (DoxX/SURF4 family)
MGELRPSSMFTKSVSLRHFLGSNKTISVLQVILGGVYLYAGLSKVFFPGHFSRALSGYKLIPQILHPAIRNVLPWVELVFGILLLMNLYSKLSSIILGLLTAAFILTIAAHLVMGVRISDCGCFSQALIVSKTVKSQYYELGLIIRNIFLLLLCVLINRYDEKKMTA